MQPLMDAIASAYGLPPTLQVGRKVEQGYLNANHVLEAEGTRYFLRGYRYDDPAKIDQIHAVKRFFSERGISIPLPIPTLEGKTYVTHGGKLYALFPFIDGSVLSRNQMGFASVAALGEMLGRIHLAGREGYPAIAGKDGGWDAASFWEKSDFIIGLIQDSRERSDFDREALRSLLIKRRAVERNAKQLADFDLRPDHLIHGDYYRDNVFFDKDGLISHVFDWELARIRPRALELVRSLNFTCLYGREVTPAVFELAEFYVQSYHAVYPLKPGEFAAGVEVQYLKGVHDLWIEEEHYLKNNRRMDALLKGRTDGLEYLGQHMAAFIRQIERSL